MRKLVSLMLAALMLTSLAVLPAQATGLADAAKDKVGGAAAEPAVESTASIDLQSMPDDELRQLILDATEELYSRNGQTGGSDASADVVSDGALLYEDENLRITLNGAPEMDDYGQLNIYIILENLSDRNLLVSLENASCNGWDVSSPVADVSANGKAKTYFGFYDIQEEADIFSADQLETIRGQIRYFDPDDYDFTIENDEFVEWRFQ